MSAPYFSPTARSTPYSSANSRLGVIDVQSAIDKLALLLSTQSLVDEQGNVTFKIGPTARQIVLSDSLGEKYNVSVTDIGELTTDNLFVPNVMPSDSQVFRRPDGGLVRIGVTSEGVLYVDDWLPSEFDEIEGEPYGVVDKIWLKSQGGVLWAVGITNKNELVTESGDGYGNWFRIVNQSDELLFGVNTGGFLGLNYLPVFTASTLPTVPEFQSNALPWAFFQSGDLSKVPVYYDGSVWRYFHNNNTVL